jgi:hypothetical protein
MKSSSLINEIVDYLCFLSRKIEMNNSLSLFDINKRAEYFYADLLNLIFGYDLKNINSFDKNAVAIDLYDDKNRIAIQVTSRSDFGKYEDTVVKFVENGFNKKYSKLIILVLTRKIYKHRKKFIEKNGFVFDVESNVWSVDGEILREINNKSLDDLRKIHEFVKDNLKIEEGGVEVNAVNNFNLNGATFNESIINIGGTQSVSYFEDKKRKIDMAKDMFNRKMFYEARKHLKEVVSYDLPDKESCMYYIISSISGVEIRNLDDLEIENIFFFIESFINDNFFKILWLIVFYEYIDIHSLSIKGKYSHKEILSSADLIIKENEKMLLNGVKLSSRKSSIFMR